MSAQRLRRAVIAALVIGGLALAGVAAARTLPPAVAAAAGSMQLAGEGEMRWLGFKLYDAALWVEVGRDVGEAEHALVIRYARPIAAQRLIDVSLDEMRRLGERDEARLAHWRALLQRALPSVEAGDTLVGLHRPGRGASFWHQGRLTAHIDDGALARAFFAIWLDERTREPELRARLLGLTDTP
ncbi:MAG: chalcone isomerase family protein [Luteimonas sp.]|nr:chalcone isomerase family protein [Luteimonas sp.]